MNAKTLYNFISNKTFLRSCFLAKPEIRLPVPRILLTTDFEEDRLDSRAREFIETVSMHHGALTLFCSYEPGCEKRGNTLFQEISDCARSVNLTYEIGSHSTNHESLAYKNPSEIVSIVNESILSFREMNITVNGFRAPFLSTEKIYRTVLREMSLKNVSLQYDSSILFEGNIFTSKIHDFLNWKSPHKVGGIWELPISCLDDYHLFDKLRKDEKYIFDYWTRKVDTNIRKYNYFLLLLHPSIIGHHLSVLRELLSYCEQRYPHATFATCSELIQELDRPR